MAGKPKTFFFSDFSRASADLIKDGKIPPESPRNTSIGGWGESAYFALRPPGRYELTLKKALKSPPEKIKKIRAISKKNNREKYKPETIGQVPTGVRFSNQIGPVSQPNLVAALQPLARGIHA